MLKTKQRTAKRSGGRPSRPRMRRTTLTLPEDLLRQVERLAVQRHQTVSAAIATLIEAPLRQLEVQDRSGNGWDHLRKSMEGLTEEEQMLIDGIILGEPGTESE
jgi:hypothetical protein